MTEAEYRAGGYSPEFESLPFQIFQRVTATDTELPEVDRVYLEELGRKNTPQF